MNMITKEQLNEALKVIADYEQQCNITSQKDLTTKTPGCRVKLSKFGIEMQGKANSKIKGVVLSYLPYNCMFPNDGTVTVKWVGRSKPASMHIHQVEKA